MRNNDLQEYLKGLDINTVEDLQKAIEQICLLSGTASITDMIGNRFRRYLRKGIRSKAYVSFTIPKKSGGERIITAPGSDLKVIQKAISVILSEHRFTLLNGPSHGFERGRSIITNAQQHIGRHYLLNLDIKDFFPSISRKMIRQALIKQTWNRDVASTIAAIATIPVGDEECLAQGSPLSPVLANIVCTEMDVRLSFLAAEHNVTYTRYADDLSFSAEYNAFHKNGPFLKSVVEIITDNGFTVNQAKTRLATIHDRQDVTGLTVNEKVNINRKYMKQVRALIYIGQRYGYDALCEKLHGNAASIMLGKLNHIGQVKGFDNQQVRSLYAALYYDILHNPKAHMRHIWAYDRGVYSAIFLRLLEKLGDIP